MVKLFCDNNMKKRDQLEMVYSDFLDMNSMYRYIFYKPNGKILRFFKSGDFIGSYDMFDFSEERMLPSFNVCRYTFGDDEIQSQKLTKRFIKTLPIIKLSDFKKIISRGNKNEKI
ncbi:TPA: hypothetical protein ACT2DX_000811 [Pasteurella multocida]|uniref:hypothetical protein n=1 Tax=Pasteurella multocida TaxID=747 RepID=UPI002A57DA4C|nr:hypothetical protein [Pasteurella multocida]MDY0692581.1 hypothetical protein [Pasteurella multocida]HDR1267274.1 hypothetical protein [Pasteurella multocida]